MYENESYAGGFELYDLDNRQSKFWEGLPDSGKDTAKDALDSIQESILSIKYNYKKSVLEDRPFSEREKMPQELAKLKTCELLLKYFLK